MNVNGVELCPACMRPAQGDRCPHCGGDLHRGNAPFLLPVGAVLRRADAPGRDGWYLGAVLGQGGFGATYIGFDQSAGRRVAVKEYFPTRCAQRSEDGHTVAPLPGMEEVYAGGRYSFVKEARVLSGLEGMPSVVQALAYLETNNTAYLVMEYLDGTPLHRLVDPKSGRRIPPEKLLPPLKGLLYDVSLLHEKKVIHRDISPENLMIEKGEVRLLDFGCARESADGGNTLTIALKHGYAPVEQYQSKGQGPWTDVYALSATIYYCLTGKKPPQAMDRLVEDELVPPRKLGVDLTQRQEQALLRGMGVAPRRRFQSMEEFHTALYEGFVPGAAEETDGKAGPAVTVDAADPGGADRRERTVETAPAEDKPAPSFDLAAWLKQNKLLAGGAAAALALVVLLAAALPRLLGPGQADAPGAPSQGLESQPGAQPTGPARSMTASSEHSLLSQLEDDAVDSVVVPAGVRLNVSRHVTLTKPLRIEKDGGVDFRNGLTVAQGGRVEVEGSLDSVTLLRTMDGGTVSVGSAGELHTHMLWLEREGGLTRAPDGRIDAWGEFDPTGRAAETPWENSYYLVLDQEALFADAVHVASEEEFIQPCQGEKPMVIDGVPRFLNLGRAEVCLNSFGRPSSVLNLGELALLSEPMLEDAALANVGQVTIGPGVCVTRKGNWDTNGGMITVSGGTYVLEEDSGAYLNNYGVISLENGARLINGGEIRDYGAITVSPDSAVEGSGTIRRDGDADPDPTPAGDETPPPSESAAAEPQPTPAPTSAPSSAPEPASVRIGGRNVPLDATELDLTELGISDISPLARLTNLRKLILRNNPVSDLSPLAGLANLNYLDLLGTRVSDISPLRGLTRLSILFLDGTQVSDVSPLRGLTAMTELHLDGTRVSDVSVLSGMTAMYEVTFCRCPVRDISVVRNMPGLRACGVSGTQVTDLTSLYSLHLDWLLVGRNQFTSSSWTS